MRADLESGFRVVAEEHLPGLRRFARALARDPHHGDDLVQGALERLYVAWPRAHGVTNPGAYLRTTVVRLAVSESRRPWRRERPSDVLPEPVGAAATAGSDGAAGADLRLDLSRALAALSVKQRAIVVLRYLEDRSVAEVADVMGVATGTVKRQSADAVVRLRRTLGEDFLDDRPLDDRPLEDARAGWRPAGRSPDLDADPHPGGTR